VPLAHKVGIQGYNGLFEPLAMLVVQQAALQFPDVSDKWTPRLHPAITPDFARPGIRKVAAFILGEPKKLSEGFLF
jgi:hypothetical protein